MDKTEAFELNDLADLGAADTAYMTVAINGKQTSWKWIWAGPGHPKTVAFNERMSRERLAIDADREQKRHNGRKVKVEALTPAEDLNEKIEQLLARLVGWTQVKVAGSVLEFSAEAARKILSNPDNHGPGGIYIQCWEFLGNEQSFTKGSGTNSGPSLNEASA